MLFQQVLLEGLDLLAGCTGCHVEFSRTLSEHEEWELGDYGDEV
jgi:hypothetical protein